MAGHGGCGGADRKVRTADMECEGHIKEVTELVRQLLDLVRAHQLVCSNDECLLFDGVVRDGSFKVKAAAGQWRDNQPYDRDGEDPVFRNERGSDLLQPGTAGGSERKKERQA
jgi:hypothetical protein